jgi:protein-disulfide isomerase
LEETTPRRREFVKSGEVKLFAAIVVIAIVLVGVAVYPALMEQRKKPQILTPVSVSFTRADLVPAGSHQRGKENAPYTLVEFADFLCPQCKQVKPEIESMVRKYADKMNYVYHHFQASPNHINSDVMARAAEAAGLQGKYWQMLDRLYAKHELFEAASDSRAVEEIVKIAADLKLDIMRFRSDLNSKAVKDRVDDQMRIALKAEVRGTPTFFIIKPDGKITKFEHIRALVDFMDNPENLK